MKEACHKEVRCTTPCVSEFQNRMSVGIKGRLVVAQSWREGRPGSCESASEEQLREGNVLELTVVRLPHAFDL